MGGGYTRDQLLRLAAKQGHSPSAVQFARWHRFGLLPEPNQNRPGRGSEEFVYPRHTAEQLVRLCELRKEKHTRNRHELAWHLWWEGYEVRFSHVREFLQAVAGGWDDNVELRAGTSREDQRALFEAELATASPTPDGAKLLSRVTHRVGKANRAEVFLSLLAPSEGAADVSEVMEGLGLQFLFGTVLGQAMLSTDDAQEIVETVRETATTTQSDRLRLLSDDDLNRRRVRFAALQAAMQRMATMFRQVGGESDGQLMAAIMPTTAAGQARLLLTLGPILDRDSLTAAKAPPGQIGMWDVVRSFELLEQLMHEVHALRDDEILTPRRLKLAARKPRQFERLVSAIWEFAKDSPDELEEFLAVHPEARPRLYPENTNRQTS